MNIELGERTVAVNLGKAVKGVTTRAFDPIKSTHANINLSVSVYMSATDIENQLVKPSGSKIKAAINKALSKDSLAWDGGTTFSETKPGGGGP